MAGRLAGTGTHYTLAVLDARGNPTDYKFEFPSVTSILDAVVAKPRLQHWFYKTTVDGLSKVLDTYGDKTPHDAKSLKSLMKTLKVSPYSKRDEAGAKGHDVHSDLEVLCEGKMPTLTPENQGLLDWWKSKGLVASDILASEIPLVSFRYGYAGTVDLVYRDLGGNIVLCDLKTSKYLFWTHLLQGEAYAEAWAEMNGTRPDKVSVLHVRPKGSGEGELPDGYKEVSDPSITFETFANILEIYRCLPVDWMPEEME